MSTPAPAATGSGGVPPPGALFGVLTMQVAAGAGIEVNTVALVMTAGPGATRVEVFDHLRGKFPAQFRDNGTVVFFSAEPNQLTAAAG